MPQFQVILRNFLSKTYAGESSSPAFHLISIKTALISSRWHPE